MNLLFFFVFFFTASAPEFADEDVCGYGLSMQERECAPLVATNENISVCNIFCAHLSVFRGDKL